MKLRRWPSDAPRVLEAAVCLVTARVIFALSPARGAARILSHMTAPQGSGVELAVVPGVAVAVERASRWLSGSTCLSRAVAGWLMLRRRGVSSVVRLGARHVESKVGMHAWLEVAGSPTIGGEDAHHFVPLIRHS